MTETPTPMPAAIPALTPRDAQGLQFVVYGDACAGVAGSTNSANQARVNAVIRRLEPVPEFLVFTGDEIVGLTADEAALREQWQHWWGVEMAWAAGRTLYNTTGNHTTYDAMSRRVFADAMTHLRPHGPKAPFNYTVRRGGMALIVVDTLDADLGGEGHVDTDWLAGALADHRDARWKLVAGHHPAFPVNGYAGACQRQIAPEHASTFWDLLVAHQVTAYLTSHILAFDVQCHRGVLQITTAGAGTDHRMPDGIEYLHAVQLALDTAGLRLQVLDDAGDVRERLAWPPSPMTISPAAMPTPLASGPMEWRDPAAGMIVTIDAALPDRSSGARETFLAGHDAGTNDLPLWIGLIGTPRHLAVQLQPFPGRSPHLWLGPALAHFPAGRKRPGGSENAQRKLVGARSEPRCESTSLEHALGDRRNVAIDLALLPAMGPGGLLWRWRGAPDWSSMTAASAWGLERLSWPGRIRIGARPDGSEAFRGPALTLAHQALKSNGSAA